VDGEKGEIWLDGRLLPWRDATFHIMNQGLHYGMAVFEGERTYAGRIFRLADHTDRLINSALTMGYEIPYSQGEIELATMQVIKASGLRYGYVRPFAWPGGRYMDLLPRDNTVHLAVAVWRPDAGHDPATKARGLQAMISQWRRPDPRALPGNAKSAASWAVSSIVRQKAIQQGFEDAIMLSWNGYLAGTTGANIFLSIDGGLHTPQPAGYIGGFTWKTVMELMARRGIEVVVRTIHPDEIVKAREVFITSTAHEITPITRIDDRKFSVGPLTKLAASDYQEFVHSSGEQIN
jgi:branched-chain amino acid aminotransferase